MNNSKFAGSLKNAIHGIIFVFRNERNFKIQFFLGLLVMIAAIFFRVNKWEFCVMLILVASVLSAEIVNSALEKLIDLLRPRLEERVKIVKDISAAMVLLVSVCSVVIGVLIFWPYVEQYFR